jgi:hypothetical protein
MSWVKFAENPRKTNKEDETLKPFEERYPEEARAAREIVKQFMPDIARAINEKAATIKSDSPYKAKGILESFLSIVQQEYV